MGLRLLKHLRANAVAYLALFCALGGTTYAATQINGKAIKKHSLPGNRLKKNTVTGKQVNESSLGTVPKASNANALGGVGKSGFGQGIVSGAIRNVPNGSRLVPPYGYFDIATDFSAEAIAPVKMTVRDFVGEAVSGFAAGTVNFNLDVTDPQTGATTHPLCQVSGMTTTCRASGPITIAQGDTYRLETVGAGLGAAVVVGFQYREAAG